MSCVFGINCESLVNPRDPLISNARRLLTQGKWRVFLLRLLLVIPLGRTLMGSSWFSKVFFGAFDPILSTAREMVALKRNNKCSGRKVGNVVLLALFSFFLFPAGFSFLF